MAEFDWTKGVIPSIIEVGPNGPYHPALQNGSTVWYWPNITFETAKEARDRALLCLSDAIQPAAEIVAAWNIYKA